MYTLYATHGRRTVHITTLNSSLTANIALRSRVSRFEHVLATFILVFQFHIKLHNTCCKIELYRGK